ncbi:MAG: type II toxin-antitoxin system Phd/YefM family antitoxin [Acidimicrobiia bacterium]
MERVGVRELRQNLSVYLQRVKDGESLEVTEHGHPVAVLAPRPAPESTYDLLVAAGRLRPGSGSIMDLAPPLGPVSTAGSDALAADREGKE